MPSTLYNAVGQQGSFAEQLAQFKAQFAPNTDPRQIIQNGLQRGQFSQEQLNAAYAQMQQMQGGAIPRL